MLVFFLLLDFRHFWYFFLILSKMAHSKQPEFFFPHHDASLEPSYALNHKHVLDELVGNVNFFGVVWGRKEKKLKLVVGLELKVVNQNK